MAERIEEQTLPSYNTKRYYPVRIGQRFVDRYRIITKLGYGAHSTVWLARDERTATYTSIKVFVHETTDTSPALNEIKMLQYLKRCPRDHPGSTTARLPEDDFQLDGPTGRHHCIVSEPQSSSLWTIQHMFPDSKLPREFVMDAVHRLLACINWLHLDCSVIHSEITTQNVLAQAAANDTFETLARNERDNPCLPVLDDSYPVYTSRGNVHNLLELTGQPILTDFGSSRMGNTAVPNRGWWMPDTYRAPEISMGLPWGYEIDVWSVGIMAVELREGRNLFNPIDSVNKQYVLPLALAQYIGVMGPPPLWIVQQSGNPIIPTFFDEQGSWISEVPVPQISIDEWITSISPGEEKEKFLRFIKRILTWDPAQRAGSGELFEDEWLLEPEVGI